VTVSCDDDDDVTRGSGTEAGVASVVIACDALLIVQPPDVHAYIQCISCYNNNINNIHLYFIVTGSRNQLMKNKII